MGIATFNQELLSIIKDRLEYLYNSIGYNKTPKAKDLENYFNVKESSARVEIDGIKKIVKVYNIISKK